MDHIEEVTLLFEKLSTPEKRKLANSSTFVPFIKGYLQPIAKEKALSSKVGKNFRFYNPFFWIIQISGVWMN